MQESDNFAIKRNKIPIRMRSKSYTVLIHVLVWVAFLIIPLIFIDSATGRERYMILGWFQQLLMAAYFYFNFLYLIPRFLMQRRLRVYFSLGFLGLVAVSACYVTFTYFTLDLIEHRHPFHFWRSALFPLYPSILAFGLSIAVRITQEWFRNERQKKEMEAEKLASELAFLKSQVNPHFLFNILNNICSLARKKSDETENAIIKLSQIMRYMLQDSRDEKVNLEKEVEYLRSYIELQQLRLAGTVHIDFRIDGSMERCLLEPMLLIPFVENAFKHGVSYQEPSEISIVLQCLEDSLVLTVDNTIAAQAAEPREQGSGIGLKNVTRRLELLYPDRHQLIVNRENNRYHVQLTIRFQP